MSSEFKYRAMGTSGLGRCACSASFVFHVHHLPRGDGERFLISDFDALLMKTSGGLFIALEMGRLESSTLPHGKMRPRNAEALAVAF